MRKADLLAIWEPSKRRLTNKDHVLRCLFNPNSKTYSIVEELLEKSKTSKEFYEKVLLNPELKTTQGYGVLSKLMPGHETRLREMMACNMFFVEADAGSVRIGSPDGKMSILIPNGYGDGLTNVAVFDDNTPGFNKHMMNYETMVMGEIGIYDYDCIGGKIIKVLPIGAYGIYIYNGYVVFSTK